MKMKKILAGALAAVFTAVGLPQIFAADEDVPVVTKKYGDFEYEVLDDGTVSIADYSGDDENVVIPDTIDGMAVTVIGDWAFSGCASLIEIVIPNSVTTIESFAFHDCTSLAEIAISDSVTAIGEQAFGYCTSLTSIDVSENNPNYVSIDGVLYDKNVTDLMQYPIGKQNTEYTIPNSVTTIEYGAFSYCASLTEIVIPDGVAWIYGGMFFQCLSLESITFLGSDTRIDDMFRLESGGGGYDTYIPENLTIYGYVGSTAEAYAKKYEINFEIIEEEKEEASKPSTDEDTPLEDKDTGITASAADGVIPAGAALTVKADKENSAENTVAYDITITADGKPADINGNVTVSIPVPEELAGADTYYVFYKAADGTLTDMKATYKDGVITFTTTHFSTYIVSTVDLLEDKTTPNSGIEGVAIAAGIAAVAAAAVIITKKRR